jgi:hypothetical protein
MTDTSEHAVTPDERAQLDSARERYLRDNIDQAVKNFFDTCDWCASMVLLAAQYWNDEATDAVQALFVPSVLARPDLGAYFRHQSSWDDEVDDLNLAGVEQPADQSVSDWADSWRHLRWTLDARWDSNGETIPLFAAYCSENGSQDESDEENYRPYAVWQRGPDGHVTRTNVGVQRRPWLDGVTCEDDD